MVTDRVGPTITTLKAEVDYLNGEVKKLLNLLADARTESMKLRAALKDARVSVEGWADYASDYIKEKWDLKGDLARIDAALEGE